MANDFGTAKSVLILAIVAGCFAILWPNVFYPMITGNYGNYPQKTESVSSGCCDVIFDNDINGIKIMTELCENILTGQNANNKTIISFTQGKLSDNTIELCKKTVLDKCSLDITELVTRNSELGKDYRQSLDLLRTLNSSICLRESFGISLGQIGLPRRMRIWGLNISKHMKPERPPHLHPEMMHPALREKGRAIQQSQKASSEARPPIPGMRPTLGGAGHVVPPPKGGGTMGIVMPMYTIGIVIFFLYTMLKLMFKKSGDGRTYEEFTSDADFQRDVFGLNQDYVKEKGSGDTTRLVTSAFTGLLQEVNKQISEQIQTKSDGKESTDESKQNSDKTTEDVSAVQEDDKTFEKIEPETSQESEKNVEVTENTEEENVETKTGVKVIGMETTESCEGGKWSRPETPRPPTPQNIYIPAVLPDQSKIIVTNSSTETILSSEDNAPVVLSGKVTLSLIGIQDPGNLDVERSTGKSLSDDEGINIEFNEKRKKSEKAISSREEKNSTETSDSESPIDLGKNVDQSRINQDSSLVTNG